MSNWPPQREHLRTAIRGLVGHLRASLGASGPLGDSLSKGELREEDIVRAFRPHIALRYDLLKGVVIDADGRESDPQDLVLFDTHVLPSVLGSASTRAMPVEGVAATVQVKSVATKRSIEHAVANIASAKRLVPPAERFGFPPSGVHQPSQSSTAATFFGGALFLGTTQRWKSLATAFAKANEGLPPRERCDSLCVVDQLAVVWGIPSRGPGLHFGLRAESSEAPLALIAGDDSLLFFYMTLVEHLRAWITPRFDWLDYVFGYDRKRALTFEYSYFQDED